MKSKLYTNEESFYQGKRKKQKDSFLRSQILAKS